MNETPISREATKLLHAVPRDALIAVCWGGGFIIAPKDAPPYFLRPDGTVVPIDPSETL